MMRRNFKVFLCLLMLMAPSTAFPEDTGIGDEYPSLLRGIRPLGMGNAFTAMPGSDYHAQFYNPAAINDYDRRVRVQLLSPGAEFNTGMIDLISDVLNLKDDLDAASTDAGKISTFRNFTQTHTGQFHGIATAFPLFHLRHKRFAAGIVADGRGTISLRNQAFENFEVKGRADAGAIGGTAYGFFNEALQVGVNVKVLYRAFLEELITTADILNESLSDTFKWNQWKKGVGVGTDIGVKYQLPVWEIALRPTVSVVVQDVADTRFTGGAPKTPMSVSAGAGIFPVLGDFEIAVVTDFRELNHQIDILKKIHFGTEVRFPEFAFTKLSLRGGVNQGYLASGLSLEWPIFGLHVAYYGEELGEATHAKANYRLTAQLAFGF